MPELDVPPEYEEWPFEARRYVLAEANTALELREEIDGIVGLNSETEGSDSVLQFTKDEAAAVLMALGGPQGVDSDA